MGKRRSEMSWDDGDPKGFMNLDDLESKLFIMISKEKEPEKKLIELVLMREEV